MAGTDALKKSLVSISDLTSAELTTIVDRAVEVDGQPASVSPLLAGQCVATLFERTSTRTRTAFSVAAQRLGASVLQYGPDALQTNTGESFADTGRVLGQMLDGIIIRSTRTVGEIRGIATESGLPVINAMAVEEHPTQAVCDLATLRAHFGELRGIRVLYVGEGNNTASALALALARVPGAELTLYVPPGYGVLPAWLEAASNAASKYGANVRETSAADELPDDLHAVYTTRWQTTGTTKADPYWRETFRPFHIDADFMARWDDAVFLHDLPANRGEEVAGDVLDGDRSLVWSQALMKLNSAIAVLEDRWAPRRGRPDTK
ncbi:ornithine carbamoyltransferase [Leifsonia sp. EB34]|uniref:ornithine carbamoyltransferase n=1 Tax=Leifsonia sp. EB34 TaxID=3156303 RepID=UPI003512C1F2